MRAEHDPIAFLRFVLRSGDVELAQRLIHALRADPRYRDQADETLSALGLAMPEAHITPGGSMLDSLLDRLESPSEN
jgi:hypothetical protein